MTLARDLFDRHEARLHEAAAACRDRGWYSPFPESPSRRLHPAGAKEEGLARFKAHLGQRFDLDQPHSRGWVGAEGSPFTRAPLGVSYPDPEPAAVVAAARRAMGPWSRARPEERVGACMEMLDRLAGQVFENAHATMHTTGQAFMMAFAGSGANSLDRGLEALVHAWRAMAEIPSSAVFTRSFGRGAPATLDKRYRLRPVGPALVMSCGSYPAWNAWPAVMANLATGNAVVLKPHPDAILPMAIGVWTCRELLVELGFDPALLVLAPDTRAAPAAMPYLTHPDVRIVDFTGSARFGAWIEQHCHHKQVYTETAGCNAAVLLSTPDLDRTLFAVAHSLCIFSSQMCTAAQNIWVPASGVRTPDGLVPKAEVEARLVAQVDALVADADRAAALCGAVQCDAVLDQLQALRATAPTVGRTLRDSAPYDHPEHPEARTATPLIVAVDEPASTLHQREHFGPMAFVLQAPTPADCIARAADEARRFGAISSYAWTTDADEQERVIDAFFDAGASVALNLHRQLPINYAAAYSDFHVTGLNPAGTACLTDLAFVARRFRVVQAKLERG
jgi:phenylacetic acid degradation protein paaN